jgi:hypothetical protein
MATSPVYYIDAGASDDPPVSYLAIGIAWADAADAASIPTLTGWGIILMALILAGIGAVAMHRQRAGL